MSLILKTAGILALAAVIILLLKDRERKNRNMALALFGVAASFSILNILS